MRQFHIRQGILSNVILMQNGGSRMSKPRTALILVIWASWSLAAYGQSVTSGPPSVSIWTYPSVLSTVSTVIAVLAFFRPNLARLGRRLSNRIRLYPLSNIEISFGGLGPTIGIAGTLRGVPNRQFVSSMTIEIIREHDNLTHRFDWAALRPPAAFVPPDMKEIRAAHGFSLPADE